MFQEDLKEHLSDVKEDFESYVDKRVDLLKLHLVEELSRFTASFTVKLGVLYLLFFALMFISLASAFFLGDILDSDGLGFVIVAGVYLIFVLIFILMRRIWVQKPVIKAFIKIFFPKFDKDEA
ncbi:phage holin family protein [Geofilum rubicundum]|uniref:Uncharacterized protein n=1 Tax=Geofilum rubicundum JCM 15548 TaxID=1236989 RepID=A0A0E9LT25_9BACT|nr:phage holin family protein [Geofilum rubicundum]GAO28747.1 hypothetical protein JCM15548_1871 [Geofilum rubicundum JCM 15548]